jgi:hypothetical protein
VRENRKREPYSSQICFKVKAEFVGDNSCPPSMREMRSINFATVGKIIMYESLYYQVGDVMTQGPIGVDQHVRIADVETLAEVNGF